MVALADIRGPEDLRGLTTVELDELAGEIRSFLIREVSRTGGHLGPNLGVVELTLALHRVFESPKDSIVWDTGHQSYVHKLVTGRQDFSRLKQQGGLSGYPCRAESEHDIVESSHASSSLSWADGLAKANQLRGLGDHHVVAVIGDGALTGGMPWEALNNIAVGRDRNLVVVVNDNERSYAPTIGGLAERLATLRTMEGYERVLDLGKSLLQRGGAPGRLAYETLHGVKKGIKDIVAPQGLFEDLGLKYVGPVDGHDIEAIEHALSRAKAFGGPVIVHAITEKGRGHAPALNDEADRFHAVGVSDPVTGLPVKRNSAASWTSVFADEMVAVASERADVVGITAAMLIPVGLHKFAAQYPERVFDVGIAEQHAVASAAGMARGGLHPVVAVYATFINRAFDQVMMDVALHHEPVTFVLDRAGVTGNDGASHNGMWDLSLLGIVPGMRVACPRDGARLRSQLREAIAWSEGPTALRFQKGPVTADVEAIDHVGGIDVLARHGEEDVLVVAVGSMVGLGLEVGERLVSQGIGATVVDPQWVLPVDDALAPLAARYRAVVVVEDNGVAGGVGTAVASALRAQRVPTTVLNFGLPQQFLDHASRSEVLEQTGLTAQEVSRAVVEHVARQEEALAELGRP